MKIRFAKPNSILSPWIGCYWGWESESDSDTTMQGGTEFPTIFASVENELHISYGDPIRFSSWKNGKEEWISSNGHIVGNHLSNFKIAPSGRVGFFNVRLFPGAFSSLFRIPAKEVNSHLSDLEIPGTSEYSDFIKRIRDARTFENRVRISDQYFSKLLNTHKSNDAFVNEAVLRIFHAKGKIKISELSKHLGLVKKTLERKFQERIGYNPKEFARVVRFQNAAWMRSEDRSLSDLALEAGFYDQAHFTKEFVAFSGYSPLIWYGLKNQALSLFYNTRPQLFR
ncbi:helix-turn-helix domain-containing protein [Leptospira yasudae]|uniref:HTH araC/xylS-type domain-containing protein n=1 Tax=Leptospira yasudae TaxID=2202201 RepID=A0ABX9M691_9LEPT|nr:helix-turn-helix domain-containing protein [Leptospira yasudae]RHX81427.1 hypothetical protein DLM77_04865 [Leptospira yasudae]